MTLLTLDRLRVERGGCPVVDDVSFAIGAGECVGLIGPNGAGKTTLMRAALGLERHRGRSSLAGLRPVALARAAAFLPQARQIAWPVDVQTLVGLGRLPHGGDGGPAVDAALRRMGLEGFRHRIATQLSGGEQARVLIARALAQETPLLIADEPLAGLDPAHQIAGMEVLAGLAAEGRAVLLALHDLGLAARFCTRLLLMHAGRLVADGPPAAVLTNANLASVFRIRAFRADGPDGPVVQPVAVLEDAR
jgi:iron complex transport system ATP-binding protein